MGIVENIIQALQRTKTSTDAIIDDSTDEVKKLIRLQLRHGINGTGNAIQPKYIDEYGQFKLTLSSYGLDGRTPDLFLSGDFYKSITAKFYKNNTIFVDSKIEYYLSLHNRYGSSILNLAPVSVNTYQTLIFNKILTKQKEIWR